ncbi:MAG TPA: ParB N-terminal domain-containing protein [Candidatus Angelobacter sp.]|nr:ParB N-terminal domain-containing protein [Candidatus Angelobacter sp.]
MTEEIKLVPIDQIRILNPRSRDRKKFEIIVQSIKNLGLKKPIQVSLRGENETEKSGYDLVCGQGRIEAFKALGYKEIPAIVVKIPKEDRLLRSLVENMARRFPAPGDILREIERLKTKGYTNTEIAKKLGTNITTINGFLTLKKTGEERLLQAALTGKVPVFVAIEIARADSVEAQRALLKAYETKKINWDGIRTIKRLIAQRRFLGKRREKTAPGTKKVLTSAQSVVRAYRREGERLKSMVRKAKFCNAELTFVVTAFSKLLDDDNFSNLLRAEALFAMPKNLWTKIKSSRKEAA